MYGSLYSRASCFASITSGGSFSRKSDSSILGEDRFVVAVFCFVVITLFLFLFLSTHRPGRDRFDDRQIDREQDGDDHTGHEDQDQRLQQGRQLFELYP